LDSILNLEFAGFLSFAGQFVQSIVKPEEGVRISTFFFETSSGTSSTALAN